MDSNNLLKEEKETKKPNYDNQERTLELIKQAQEGCEDAIEQLVEDNVGLIWSSVARFTNRGIDTDDLFQIGSIGLIKCIKKFDTSYNVKFSTYAVPMIMGEIKRFLRDDGIIKVSRPLKELAIKSKQATETLSKKLGRTPTISEVAEAIDCDINELMVAMESNREVESLYATYNNSNGQSMFLIDKVHKNNNNEEKIVDNISLKQIINNLKDKERKIIIMRYFNDKTQKEVADVIGISQVQVSRIEKKVLEKMHNMLKS